MEIKSRLTDDEKKRLGELYEAQLPLLNSIVNRYCFWLSLREDVLQQASLHMLDLLQKYDSDTGVPLYNYLYIHLKGRVMEIVTSRNFLINTLEGSIKDNTPELCPKSDSIAELLPDDFTPEDVELLTRYYVDKHPLRTIDNGLSPIKNWRRIKTLLERLRKANE